ncbi:MAG: hypothetical protein LBI01_01590 [Elusimicrobium sp.]|jgi:hypothetical protein|nr:hypothetical protein [Elusimicrobium sp.]
MHTLSKIFIYTVIMCVAILAAYRGYGLYSTHIDEVNARKDKTNTLFATIPSAPEEVTQAVQPHLSMPGVVSSIDYGVSTVPTETELNAPATYDYTPDNAPSALPKITADEDRQARAQKAFDKYLSNPLIKQFNADMQNAGIQNMDFSRLATADAADALQQNPKLRDIFIKYSQNPEFIALIRQMGTDPEIKAVTQELQEER